MLPRFLGGLTGLACRVCCGLSSLHLGGWDQHICPKASQDQVLCDGAQVFTLALCRGSHWECSALRPGRDAAPALAALAYVIVSGHCAQQQRGQLTASAQSGQPTARQRWQDLQGRLTRLHPECWPHLPVQLETRSYYCSKNWPEWKPAAAFTASSASTATGDLWQGSQPVMPRVPHAHQGRPLPQLPSSPRPAQWLR